MKKFHLASMIILLIMVGCTKQKQEAALLINHLGYAEDGVKKVVFQTTAEKAPKAFHLVTENGEKVYEGTFQAGGKIDNWHTGNAFAGYFSDFKEAGKYAIKVKFEGETIQSTTFEISNKLLVETTLPLMLKGYKSIHPEKKYEDWDSNVPFYGDRKDKVDAHGGWYDASGDFSKYFSHLCYTNFMAPQQTPMVVYNMFASAKNIEQQYPEIAKAYIEESAYGADFLVRMQDPEGYFYTIIFDTWSKDPTVREICAYETNHGTRTDEYQAAFREGAGIAIAALAKLSANNVSGEFSSEDYLKSAERGFAHLLENNTKYCDDGVENIIDDYCALMAASELYQATEKEDYLKHAQLRAKNLVKRVSADENYKGWFSANQDASRPYFHAAEAGYPLIALGRYLDVEKDEQNREKVIAAIQQSVAFQLTINAEVNNPFGYPRQYVKATNEEKSRGAFFIPHTNESGYWYQGENARLASLAAAFNLVKPYMLEDQQAKVADFSQNHINWILGLNPYNMCMLDGVGYNNPEYLEPHDWNYLGGIANGITAGVGDESDIAFLPDPQKDDPAERWRWPEQWIPHAGWFMLAVTTTK